MKLIQKLILGFSSIAILLAIVGLIQVASIFNIKGDLQEISLSNTGEIEGAIKIAHLVAVINTDIHEYLFDSISAPKLANPELIQQVKDNIVQLDKNIAILKSATEAGESLAETEEKELSEESELEEIARLEEMLLEYKDLIHRTLQIAETQSAQKALAIYHSNNQTLEKEIRLKSRDLFNDALGEIQEEVGEIGETVETTAIAIGFLTLLAFSLAIIIGILVSKRLSNRINRLKTATLKIQQGDWDVQVSTSRLHDEVDELALAFNEMARNLKVSTASIKDLNRQIQKRKGAEAALQKAHDELETRVKQRTLELENAKIEAETANHTKSKFLAHMSHELRTPLNHIIGFTELIADEKIGSLNEIQKEYLSDVLASSSHLLMLINDILDLSKVEAGKMELRLSNVDLQPMLNSCVAMFKENAMKHRIDLVLESATAPETLLVDDIKLKQILYNLISNAFKFTPDGGRIIVKAWQVEGDGNSRPEYLKLPGKGAEPDVWAIAVSDSGIGILPEELELIFKPFEQSSNQKTNAQAGTGLGLALTRKMVELHGGVIKAHSDGPELGATFTIVLPRMEEIQAASSHAG